LKVSADFVTSATGRGDFPRESLPELALAGRSNVGKSSLINALVRRKVARTSAAPGKTRLANFYRVTTDGLPPFHLVDLPGYGYARGGEPSAREFQAITGEYFARRDAATDGKKGPGPPSDPFVLLLVDSRHPGLDADRQAWEWLGALAVPRQVVATKVDKLSRAERGRHVRELEHLHEGPVLPVSVQTGEGLNELWELIATRLRPPRPQTPPPPRPSR
jgi:GTP-binding protein